MNECELYDDAMVRHDVVLEEMEEALNSHTPWALVRACDGECELLNSLSVDKPLGSVLAPRKFMTEATWRAAGLSLLEAVLKADFVALPWSGLVFTIDPLKRGKNAFHIVLADHGIDWTHLRLANITIGHYLAQVEVSKGWMRRLCEGRCVGIAYRSPEHATKRFNQIAEARELTCITYTPNTSNASVVERFIEAGVEFVLVSGGFRGKKLTTDLKQIGLVALDYGFAIELQPDHKSGTWEHGFEGPRCKDGPPL